MNKKVNNSQTQKDTLKMLGNMISAAMLDLGKARAHKKATRDLVALLGRLSSLLYIASQEVAA